jgi:hypothetical protein
MMGKKGVRGLDGCGRKDGEVEEEEEGRERGGEGRERSRSSVFLPLPAVFSFPPSLPPSLPPFLPPYPVLLLL